MAEYKNNTAVHIKQYFPRQKATQDTKPDQQSLTIRKCACQQVTDIIFRLKLQVFLRTAASI